MHITLVTCLEMPALIPEDALFRTALETRRATVSIAPWNGPFSPFQKTDLVVIRTPWDYTAHATKFKRWLDDLEADNMLVSNPVPLMRWNMNKTYLMDLQKKGAPLPPTLVARPEVTEIQAAAANLGLEEMVIKPVISASSKGLARLAPYKRRMLEQALTGITCDMLVQAFVPEIETLGETSLVFLAGEFSHAVCKRPKAGDIRCQEEFGGSAELVTPPSWAVARAKELLTLLPAPADYARVDVIIRADDLILMEIELIEPELFFRLAPEAAELFARQITQGRQA